MPKIGRNVNCPCDSGKKYKKCCIGKDIAKKQEQRSRIIYGDEYYNSSMETLANELKEEFPDHEIIDVSKVLEDSTYRSLQVQHYKSKVIMVAFRTASNNSVFAERCPDDINFMIMYRGAYQCISSLYSIDQVYQMINKRLNNLDL